MLGCIASSQKKGRASKYPSWRQYYRGDRVSRQGYYSQCGQRDSMAITAALQLGLNKMLEFELVPIITYIFT